MAALQKTKNRIFVWSNHTTLWDISEGMLSLRTIETLALFIAPLFTTAKLWSQPRGLSTGKWEKKITHTHTCTHTHAHMHIHTPEYYLAKNRMKLCHFQENW
jgi:hypothetical protein